MTNRLYGEVNCQNNDDQWRTEDVNAVAKALLHHDPEAAVDRDQLVWLLSASQLEK